MKKFIIKASILSLIIIGTVSCSQESLEPELATERDLNTTPVSSITDLEYLVNGMYKRMRGVPYYGRDYIIFNEARTDNAYSIASSNRFVTVTEMRVNDGDAYPADSWLQMYRVVLNANYIINADVTQGDQVVIDDYKGQALIARAVAHFDLMKLFGQQHIEGQGGTSALTIPYVEQAAANSSEVLASSNQRFTLSELRTKIYADLDEGIEKISNSSVKTKITKQAAYGFKSRVALYFATFFPEDYQLAYDAAVAGIALGGSVIPADGFISQFSGNVVDVNSVFELAMPSDDHVGNEGLSEIYNGTAYGDIVAQPGVDGIFEEDDVRGDVLETVGPNLRNMGKYTAYADNVIVMRFEELLLNAAEAAVAVDPGAVLGFVNQIREARGIDALTTASLDDVKLERRKELMFEGFRFDDLMRWQEDVPTNPRMTETYPYGHFRIAFPIPLSEINASGMQQNYGY